jgi:DHA3 family macrolide efflux protein-like MFS transporter
MFLGIKHEKPADSKLDINKYIDDLKGGFSFIRKSYMIKVTLIMFAITNFCLAPINVLQPAYVSDVLNGGAELLSILGIALTVGIIVSGLLMGMFGNKFKKSRLICFGMIFFGISYSLLFIPGNIIATGIASNAVAITAFFLLGFCTPVLTTPLMTNIMLNTDKDMLGRVGSFVGMISCCAIPLGSAAAGSLSEIFSISALILAMGIVIILVGIRMAFNSKFRQND